MSIEIKVQDIMESDVITVRTETTVKEVYALMSQYGLGDFPVIDINNKFKGMIYEEHLLKHLYPKKELMSDSLMGLLDMQAATSKSRYTMVSEIMATEIDVIPHDQDILLVGAKLLTAKARVLPVVQIERVVGTVSQTQVFKALMEFYFPTVSSVTAAEMMDYVAGNEDRNPHSGKDQRLFHRMPVKMDVAYRIADTSGRPLGENKGQIAHSVNVSAGGMLLATREELPRHTLLELAFDLSRKETIKRLARVVRCRSSIERGVYHAGIMFLAMSTEERIRIEKYLSII
ncbi:MAG: CBS domain-containing protein [Candidatus Omnitrophota bacterium]|nr:CBS domain-containing protein [Candidatus Omnitrophota bacterium]